MKLILLPGMDGTGELFQAFTAALPGWVTVQVVSYPPAVELSYAELQASVSAVLGAAESWVLLGESFSTPIAVGIAASRPAGLKAVVICAGFVSPPVRGVARQLLKWLAPLAFRFGISRSMVKWALLDGACGPELQRTVRNEIAKVAPKVLAHRLRAILTCDCRAQLRKILVPILYVGAGKDPLLGSHCVEEISRIRPDAKVQTIAGPHLIVQAKPVEVAACVLEFLQSDAL